MQHVEVTGIPVRQAFDAAGTLRLSATAPVNLAVLGGCGRIDIGIACTRCNCHA